jgi:hypothetical protein
VTDIKYELVRVDGERVRKTGLLYSSKKKCDAVAASMKSKRPGTYWKSVLVKMGPVVGGFTIAFE